MAEYIEKQETINALRKYFVDEENAEIEFGAYWYHTSVEQCIKEMPSADVQPVVRCRDCFANGLCSVQDVLFNNDLDKAEDFFCANGRMEEK